MSNPQRQFKAHYKITVHGQSRSEEGQAAFTEKIIDQAFAGLKKMVQEQYHGTTITLERWDDCAKEHAA